MTYYERLKNAYDRNVYCSPDERTERFMQLVEADKEKTQNEINNARLRIDAYKKEIEAKKKIVESRDVDGSSQYYCSYFCSNYLCNMFGKLQNFC